MKELNRLIETAAGRRKADIVIKDARYLNVYSLEVLRGDIAICDGHIAGIGEYEGEKTYYTDGLIVPGFIDGHIHIESAMTTPEQFGKCAIKHGTTTVICDPHEIANVSGIYGIRYMIESARLSPIDIKFMLPSCVPATKHDENYAALGAKDLAPLYRDKAVLGLAEVMDYNAVINCEPEMLSKLTAALIDGHAPSLSGKDLNAYVAAGIKSDHECTTFDEALDKLRLGQYIMIRQGTAAKNLDALLPLLDRFSDRIMFVTDDMHPDELLKGHIDAILREAVLHGADPIKAIRSATLVPSICFGLRDRGAIAPGLRADLAVLSDDMRVIDTFSAFRPHGRRPKWDFGGLQAETISDIGKADERTIGIVAGQILTDDLGLKSDVKLFTLERHHGTGHRAACGLKGYGEIKGAVATTIAHDSHNIIAAGMEGDIVTAVNELIRIGGGIAVASGNQIMSLPLEIGGIMSARPVSETAAKLESIKNFAYELGVNRDIDPFMTLSFLSLPVIPSLRLLPRGLIKV